MNNRERRGLSIFGNGQAECHQLFFRQHSLDPTRLTVFPHQALREHADDRRGNQKGLDTEFSQAGQGPIEIGFEVVLGAERDMWGPLNYFTGP